MKTDPKAISVADRLGVLGEAVRLRMLRLLEREELSVGEVASVFQLAQSSASRHLKVLGEAGWLVRRAVGTSTHYRLTLDDLAPEARALWSTIRTGLTTPELGEDDRRLAGVLAERMTDSRAFFGRIAGEWDAVRAELFGERFTAPALLGLIRPDWVVADLGCGTGNAAELLAPCVERVIAVDESEPMLRAAGQRLDDAANVECRRGELESLPLDDASVDAVVCLLVLHHVGDPGVAVREMRRVLRPDRGGGVALIVDMVEHERDEYRRSMGHQHRGFGREQIESMLGEAGFASPVYRVLPSDPEARGPDLFAATGWLDYTRE